MGYCKVVVGADCLGAGTEEECNGIVRMHKASRVRGKSETKAALLDFKIVHCDGDYPSADSRVAPLGYKPGGPVEAPVLKAPDNTVQDDLHEVYVKTEMGLQKFGEVRGTRKQQVELRRAIRSKSGTTGDKVVLYTNGKLKRFGIDKGAK